ncbi:DNA repair protein RecN [Reichenbachiella versicolor]|uniref:DNA repair protein RecN n=1 Tax=Reichenbachiella versicolor TaxID=1821036 RepID=UPI000D6E3ABF|nr:DNA repair protein RecN [Reichenbachiella versicolor]
MISKLSISNYALIRQLDIEPDKALNIVTGETGAGKSIMLGAIGLLLGNRADTKALLNEELKCVIEGEFDVSSLKLQDSFEEWDVDYDDHSILRREISPKGKSRAFINDQPVTLDVIKEIGQKLVDIHSQNQSTSLSDKKVKMGIVDGFAQTQYELEVYQTAFDLHAKLKKKLLDLLEQQTKADADSEYKRFLLDELVKADLKEGEFEQLEGELKMLENAEDIKLKLSQIYGEFEESELSVNDRLKEVVNTLKSISGFSSEIESFTGRLNSATTEIFDIISGIGSVKDTIEYDPERIATVSERLDMLNRLLQKHNISSVEQLVDIKIQLEEHTSLTETLTESIESINRQVDEASKDLLSKAEILSEKRRSIIDALSSGVNELLGEVGMPEGQFEIAYKRVEPWKLGIDEVEVLFSANKGVSPEPVAKVASGGEFSRLMFCIKFMLAQKTAMPTVIFDEIDTGVSGEIALKMGDLMKKMSFRHQIISISHLPQVAAKGDQHYYVYKDNSSDKTESLIKLLDESDRLEEIAKMIGGENPSEIAKNSARELIGMNA